MPSRTEKMKKATKPTTMAQAKLAQAGSRQLKRCSLTAAPEQVVFLKQASERCGTGVHISAV
jgi:hypothetical protein